jgi:hypothetical protein
MKKKILFLVSALVLGMSIAYACSYAECGGGSTTCCKDVFGATYYCPPPKVTPP